MKYTALLLTIVGLFFLSSLQPELTTAFTMTDANYILQMENFNNFSGAASGSNKNITFTSGETANGFSSSNRYIVRAGFQYIKSIIPFSFSIDTNIISFGTLSTGSFTNRTNTLTVSDGSAGGFIVTAQENHPLLNPGNGAQIADTTCDVGTPCTESTSGTWSSPLTYGFGYRCDVLTTNFAKCGSGFTSGTSFKQFANTQQNEAAQIVTQTGTQATRSGQIKITYQANINTTQPGGNYSNVITYIATPTF